MGVERRIGLATGKRCSRRLEQRSINILTGHTVSINGGDRISADELVVDLGGVLEVTP